MLGKLGPPGPWGEARCGNSGGGGVVDLARPMDRTSWCILLLALAGCVFPAAPSRSDGALRRAHIRPEPTHASPASREPRNFESASGADAWFRGELTRLNALPIVVAHRPDVGYVAEVEADGLAALARTGTPLYLRRRGDRAKRPVPADGPALPDGFLYEFVGSSGGDPEPPGDDAGLGVWLRPEESPVQLLLAFVHPARVQLAPLLPIAIPPEVIRGDLGPEPDELVEASHCLLAPSGRHCLAIYAATDADHRETRLRVVLYDSNWTRLGSTGRTPRSWPMDARRYLRRFSVVGLFDVLGLDHPVFVTTAFAQRSPCWEYRLHTFSPDGELATVPLSNGTVADGVVRGFCSV